MSNIFVPLLVPSDPAPVSFDARRIACAFRGGLARDCTRSAAAALPAWGSLLQMRRDTPGGIDLDQLRRRVGWWSGLRSPRMVFWLHGHHGQRANAPNTQGAM